MSRNSKEIKCNICKVPIDLSTWYAGFESKCSAGTCQNYYCKECKNQIATKRSPYCEFWDKKHKWKKEYHGFWTFEWFVDLFKDFAKDKSTSTSPSAGHFLLFLIIACFIAFIGFIFSLLF